MDKSLSELHLAAYAVAAMKGQLVNGLREPSLFDTEFAMQGVTCEDGSDYLVILATSDNAISDLQTQQPLLTILNDFYRMGDLSFTVPDCLGDVVTRAGGYAVVNTHFGAELLSQSHEHTQADSNSGSLFNVESWAKPLGRALAELHKLPTEAFSKAGLQVTSARQAQKELLDNLDEAAGTGRLPSILAHRWEQGLEDVSLWHYNPVLIHTNLAPTCIFGSSKAIAGIVDWGEARIGDPAVDLASILSGATTAFTEKLWNSYRFERRSGIDPNIERRVELMSELALVQWLLHGVHIHSQEIIDDAASMMNELAHVIEAEESRIEDSSDISATNSRDDLSYKAPPRSELPTTELSQQEPPQPNDSSSTATPKIGAADDSKTEALYKLPKL